MDLQEFFTSKRVVSSLIVVIVSVGALFGIELQEQALTDVWEQAVQLLAVLGIGGGAAVTAWVAKEKRRE